MKNHDTQTALSQDQARLNISVLGKSTKGKRKRGDSLFLERGGGRFYVYAAALQGVSATLQDKAVHSHLI